MVDEEKLVRKLAKGDSRSFNLLYDRYVSSLYSFVYQYVKSDQTASEIVQETFVKLWTKREGLDPEKSVKSYLFTICYHKLIKELRRQVRNPLMTEYVGILEQSGESQPAFDFDHYMSEIRKAKAELPARQRQIFELAKEDGLSVKEMIPDALDLYNGVSVPTFTLLPDGRCIMAGWTNNEGWGGNLVMYEVVQHADGTLGTRWMDEVAPVVGKAKAAADGPASFELDRAGDCLLSFEAVPDREISVRFTCNDRPGETVEWFLEPEKNRASYVWYNTSGSRPGALLISEGGCPEWMKNYAVKTNVSGDVISVRMMIHNEAKMSGTLVDTEINRDRTMLDHHPGFKFDSVVISGNVRKAEILSMK